MRVTPTLIERGVLIAALGMLAGVLVLHPSPLGALLVVPLAACLPGVVARRARAFVLAGTVALPYLCYAIVELLSTPGRPAGALLLFGSGVVLMMLLAPATRLARRRD